jgi:hypothetical protein
MKRATRKNNKIYSCRKEHAEVTEEQNKRMNDQQPCSSASRTKTEKEQTLHQANEGVLR